MSVPTRRTPYNEQSGNGEPIYDMELPFDPNGLKRNARAHGFNPEEAGIFAHMALQTLREAMAKKKDGEPVTALQIAEAIKQHATDEVDKETALQQRTAEQGVQVMEDVEDDESDELLENHGLLAQGGCLAVFQEDGDSTAPRNKRFKFTDDGLEEYFGAPEDPYGLSENIASLSLKHHGFDLITGLCQRVELAVELAKHLRPEDILKLYSVSKAFHDSLDGHLLSSIRQIIAYSAPEAGRTFPFKLYRRLLVPDPAGRTWAEQLGPQASRTYGWTMRQVRSVPGLKYLQLVLGRDRCCREMVAIMARHGHRTPPGMYKTLLRMWLLMDISTSRQRRALLRNRELWTDTDLYNAQLFILKLGMHFNDPVYGPLTYDIPNIILGQKGLYLLWQVLMRRAFTSPAEILDAKVRYDFEVPPDHGGHDLFDADVFGVPFREVGIGHMEGWGTGNDHLMRPDELIPHEAVVRGLHLDEHLMHMMAWGYFDWETGENLVPTEEEMYISDEERTLAHMDTGYLWQPRHARKKRWNTLTEEQQREIRADDDDDRLRALAWAAEHPCGIKIRDEDKPPTLDDEINRGFILRAQEPGHRSHGGGRPRVPSPGDHGAWADFATKS